MKKRKKEGLDLREQFREAKSYLRKSQKYIYFTILLFLLSTVAGFVFQNQLTFIDQILKELISKTEEFNTPEMIFFILQNNLMSSFYSILLGLFIGFFPLMSSVSNGVILGYVLERSYQVVGILSWWRLLPHGIFELPAIFISFGLGLKLGTQCAKTYFRYYWKESNALIFLPIILALVSFLVSLSLVLKGDQVVEGILAQVGTPLLVSINLIWNLVMYFTLFVLFTYVFNPKLRKIQDKHLKVNFYNSFNVFLTVIIPLLIVAAIIEGLLIGLSV